MSGDIRSPTMISRRSAAEKHENLTFSEPYPGASFVAPGYLWTGTDGQYLIFVASSSCFSLGLSSDGFYGGGENWYSTAISVRTHWYSLEQMTIIHSTLLTSLIQRNKPELDTADIKQTNFQLSPLQTFNNYNNIINHSPPLLLPMVVVLLAGVDVAQLVPHWLTVTAGLLPPALSVRRERSLTALSW